MIPLWTKSVDGKWVRFPSELLDSFPDGRYGLRLRPELYDDEQAWFEFLDATGHDIMHYFDLDDKNARYVLKGEKA